MKCPRNKVVIIGLDCADPKLVFEEFWDELPNMRNIAKKGGYGKLRSTIPPITVPAWMCLDEKVKQFPTSPIEFICGCELLQSGR